MVGNFHRGVKQRVGHIQLLHLGSHTLLTSMDNWSTRRSGSMFIRLIARIIISSLSALSTRMISPVSQALSAITIFSVQLAPLISIVILTSLLVHSSVPVLSRYQILRISSTFLQPRRDPSREIGILASVSHCLLKCRVADAQDRG